MQQAKRVSFRSNQDTQLKYCHNLIAQTKPDKDHYNKYNPQEAMPMARLINDLQLQVTEKGASFVQQYLINKGLKVFGQAGHDASKKSINQLHRWNCFSPISIAEMTAAEQKKAQQALMFLAEKRDGIIKGRMVYNGKPTREWLSREDSVSPTAALESIILTSVIDAHKHRDVMTCDIPNAFIQAEMPELKAGDEKVLMKITGVLVDMLVNINPNVIWTMRGLRELKKSTLRTSTKSHLRNANSRRTVVQQTTSRARGQWIQIQSI